MIVKRYAGEHFGGWQPGFMLDGQRNAMVIADKLPQKFHFRSRQHNVGAKPQLASAVDHKGIRLEFFANHHNPLAAQVVKRDLRFF